MRHEPFAREVWHSMTCDCPACATRGPGDDAPLPPTLHAIKMSLAGIVVGHVIAWALGWLS